MSDNKATMNAGVGEHGLKKKKIGVFKIMRGKETSIIRENNYKKRRYMHYILTM